jgi:hypothetical protein
VSAADGPDEAAEWRKHMRAGRFAEAWLLSDRAVARGRNPSLPPEMQPVWDGRPVNGKRVLLRCFHGLGDTLQFVRYAELLRREAAHVTLSAQLPLLSLLETVRGVDEVVPLQSSVDYDVDLEIMELAYYFRSTSETIPADVPYVHVRSGAPLPTPAVGLVWRAGPYDERRGIDAELLCRHLESVSGVEWHILQRGPALAQRPQGFGRVTGCDDVMQTAALMQQLDLVISVDSFPAHLAGALGVPVWTLLHFDADWRWLEHRDDSPWYPSMRLFRQPFPGDWEAVLRAVREQLSQRQWLRHRPQSSE